MKTTLDRLPMILKYYSDKLLQKGYSPNSLRSYMIYAKDFCKYLQEEEKINDLKHVDRQVVSRYQSCLFSEERGLSLRTQGHMLVMVHNFFKWLEREGVLLYDPTSQIEYPKRPELLPRDIFSEQDIKKLLDAVDIDCKLGLRDKAILELLYSCGMRAGELCKLTLYNIDREYKTVSIREGKGMKDRVLPIGDIALGYLEEFLDHGRNQFMNAKNLAWLFISRRGKQMNTAMITKVVKKYALKAGIKRYTCAHMVRHSVATHMLRNNASIREIQALLGHEKLETTQIYTKVEIGDLKRVHSKTHPREIGFKTREKEEQE